MSLKVLGGDDNLLVPLPQLLRLLCGVPFIPATFLYELRERREHRHKATYQFRLLQLLCPDKLDLCSVWGLFVS